MKRSLWISMLCMGLALFALPLAWRAVDREKEEVVILEEVLSGDPAAVSGVSLRIASHWDGHLLWDTEYEIESGKTESRFLFSEKRVEWEWQGKENAKSDFLYGSGFGTATGDNEMIVDPGSQPYPGILEAVAERVEAGEVRTEEVRISDYCRYYPVSFELEGSSVEYEGDYDKALEFLTELFQISPGEERLEISVEKNASGDIISASGYRTEDSPGIRIRDAAAFGEAGCYYAFYLENEGDGTREERGENSGIFYLPFVRTEGWIRVDLTQMRKLCPLPDGAVVEKMYLDEKRGLLYLTVKETSDYKLVVYSLEDGYPVFAQRVSLGQEHFFDREKPFEDSILLGDGQMQAEVEVLAPEIWDIAAEDGGLLITWSDNSFSFVVEEENGYRLWCAGQFPETLEAEYRGTGMGAWERYSLFPRERACLFDGERLILAAYEGWDSLNVLLAAYGEGGETYTGLYRYAGELKGIDYDSRLYRRMPQGRDAFGYMGQFYGGVQIFF